MSFKELCADYMAKSRHAMLVAHRLSEHLDKQHMVLVNQSAQVFVMWADEEESQFRLTRVGDVEFCDAQAVLHKFKHACADAVYEFKQKEVEGEFDVCLKSNQMEFQLEHMLPNLGNLVYRTNGKDLGMPHIAKAIDLYPGQEYFPKDLPVSPLEPKTFLKLEPIENRQELNQHAEASMGIMIEELAKQFVEIEDTHVSRWALVKTHNHGDLAHYATVTWINAGVGVEILGDCSLMQNSVDRNLGINRLSVLFYKNPSNARSTNRLAIFYVRSVHALIDEKLISDIKKAHKHGYEVIVLTRKQKTEEAAVYKPAVKRVELLANRESSQFMNKG